MPLPAVAVFWNDVTPPEKAPLAAAPLLVKNVLLPAVALLLNKISPLSPAPFTPVTKFWGTPEVLVMPAPVIVSAFTPVATV